MRGKDELTTSGGETQTEPRAASEAHTSGVQSGVQDLSLQLTLTLNIWNADERTLGGNWGDWGLCYLKWRHVFFFFPMVHSLVRSSRRWTGNVPVQNTRGSFPTLFILVLLPEGEGIVRLSSKTSCSGPQLFSSQQNKGCGKFINVRYVG